jgi:Ca2+-binding EF-hand superfamily protein
MLNQIKDLIKKLFGVVDTNKDGKIDVAEVTAAVDKVEVAAKEVVEKVKKARKPRTPKAK